MRFQVRPWAGGLLTLVIALVAVAVVNGQKEQCREPFPSYYFSVEIEGQTYPFKSVSGLKIETEVIEFREGGSDTTHYLPGNTKYANIKLTRAFTGDRSLYDWYLATKKKQPVKVNGHITMFDNHGVRKAAWNFAAGFPVKWEGPDYDASKNEVAIETIEIAHEGLTLADDDK